MFWSSKLTHNKCCWCCVDAEPVPVQTSAGQNDLLADLFGGSSSAGLGGAGQQNITTGQQVSEPARI